jgi:hypothetical protein
MKKGEHEDRGFKCFHPDNVCSLETLMSRGPGKIERAVEAIFRDFPDNAYTVEDMIDRVYSGINRIEKKHRVSILRAAKRICVRSDEWTWLISGGLGGTLVFFSPYNVMSYAAARIKGEEIGNDYRSHDQRRRRYPHWKSKTDQDVQDALLNGRETKNVVEGGAWWRHVQMNVAARDKIATPEIREMYEEDNRIRATLGIPQKPLPDWLARKAA